MPNFFNCLKKYIRCCPFVTIDAVLFPQLRSLEIVDPRNLNDSTCLTTVLSIKSWHIGFLCFRKSIVISQVLETFNTRLFFPHQSTILCTSSLYSVSSAFSMQPINVASSENVIKRTDWSPETQSFVNNHRKVVYVVSDRINKSPQYAVSVSFCVLSVFILTALCCDFKHIHQR